MQKIMITGNLCNKPEYRGTTDGKRVCNFTVAVNRPLREGQERREADFFRVAVWGNKAESCSTYLDKGSKVCVWGTVSTHAYIDRTGTPRGTLELMAQDVEFLGKPHDSGNTDEATYTQQERAAIQQENRPQSAQDAQSGFEVAEDDDCPF